MTLTATYNDDLARVQLAVTGAPASADYALFERSADGITWEAVRGGQTVGLSGGAGKLDDYEFVPGAPNFYRASYVDTADISFVGAGTASHQNNASTSPTLPTGLTAGDTMLLFSAITSGTTNTPAGWTVEVAYGPMTVFSRRFQAGDTAPTVTYSGGVAGSATSSVILAWRNLQPGYTTINGTINASAQDIFTPPLSEDGPKREYVFFGWKQNGAATAASTLTAFTSTTTLANAVGQSLFYARVPATSDTPSVLAQTMTVTGGAAAISRTLMFAYRPADYVTSETASTTPAMSDVWLKNVLRPNLNRKVSPVGRIVISRKSRSGVFDVVGRTMPVAVTDVRGAREFELRLSVESWTDRDVLDSLLGTGDVLQLHVPPGSPTSSAFVMVGDTSYDDAAGLYTLPLIEVARPDGTLVGDTILWADVLTEYPTWADVIAAEPTWSDLVSQIASGSETVVP